MFGENNKCNRTLVVSNIQSNVSDLEIAETFNKYGYNRIERYAEVVYDDYRDASDALNASSSWSWETTKKGEEQGDAFLFVMGISNKTTTEELKRMFGAYGRCDLNRHRTSATIFYEDIRDASDAFIDTDGVSIGGSRIHVKYMKR